ncbi:MAG: pyridoxamine 5'-phosphate oxidase family protein [Xanthomonadales bacterium]|nr:pyridoxamine 5'-phosphate oxidase family protein [Xanthomonadales bacterium]MDH4018472.1 pyridoxamine 5'-phosphate oxidase family protein [Xanthomonadales bacterium]
MTQKVDTKFKREPKRGSHDFKLACDMLDAGKICHVGFTLDEQPYVVPMAYARMGDQLLIHGSIASRLVKNLAAGLRCCVTVTHFDGLVYARSTFNSSMNYRSVMVFGVAHVISDTDEKRRCIQALVDHLMPGRRADLRMSTIKELNATSMLALPIETFSTKCRTGPPSDSKSDMNARVWAGVVPLRLNAGEPIDAPDMIPGIKRPDYL